MANVVLVLDMVRGFCEQGRSLYAGETVRQIIEPIRTKETILRIAASCLSFGMYETAIRLHRRHQGGGGQAGGETRPHPRHHR